MSQIQSIETQRLIIRRLELKDKESLFSYRSMPEVAEFQSWHPKDSTEVEAFIQKNIQSVPNQEDQWVQMAVCLKEGPMIGDIGIHFIDDLYIVELGYTLSPRYQNKGYAFEAVRAVIDLLFTHYNKHRITASVDPGNVRSIRLLERLGFRKEGHFIKSFRIDEAWFDDVVYAMLEEEWKIHKDRP